MDAPAPLTELDAVNIMLPIIGETPVNSLADDQVADVALARATLAEVNREVQASGWHFNREYEVPFARNIDGEIPIPSNVARFDVPASNPKNIIQRGTRAYNKTDRTYVFTETLKATVVYFLPFNEIPESARYYITIRAARKFAARTDADQLVNNFTSKDEADARAMFLDENEENADSTIFDHWSVARVINRPSRRTL